MSKKFCFRRPFHNQHGKRAETLLKSPLSYLLILVKEIQDEKASMSDMQSLTTVC